MSAYIIPRISEYLTNLERELVQAAGSSARR